MGVRIKYENIAAKEAHVSHGTHSKTIAVLHETVSPDIKGMADIDGTISYLVSKDYGIHGMTDKEGNMAWAYNMGEAIFYQVGGLNTPSVGIEQVSDVPGDLARGKITLAEAVAVWQAREVQLHATAKLLACWHDVDKTDHPLAYVDGSGKHKGVTSHWDVSQFFPESEGHTDCHPITKGGYYPIIEVVDFAKVYVKLGYHF